MKLKGIYLLIVGVSLGLIWGCGTDTPFQRGIKSDLVKNGDKKHQEIKPTPLPTEEPPPTETPNPTAEPTPTSSATPTPTPTISLNKDYFGSDILPMLEARRLGTVKGCSACHDNPAPTFEDAEKLVVLGHPEESPLFLRATGAPSLNHPQIWKSDSPEALKLILWISGKPIW